MRITLIAALAACANGPLRGKARRFLMGLSSDELQFIAEFLGACILERDCRCRCSRTELAERIAEFQFAGRGRVGAPSADEEHKMILLLEYLCRGGIQEVSIPLRARQS